jgi:hypothetical protein
MIGLMFGSLRSRNALASTSWFCSRADRRASTSRADLRASTYTSGGLIAICLLGACGRIGVEILPADGDELLGQDGGNGADGGLIDDEGGLDPNMDSGFDAAVDIDADLDGSAMADTGPDPIAACMMSCVNEHGGASCATGSCVATCAIGYDDCDRSANNGCEANTTATTTTCGSCVLGCTNAHGSTLCNQGVCAPTCASGFDDCDGDTDNGCETDLSAAASCGACTTACVNAHGTTSCQSGACVPACAAGYADCDGDRKNGCETNTGSDPMHCGSCPNACGSNGQVCTNGTCQASPCAAGRAECDGNLAQTCETDTTSSLSNCGFCGNVCTTANGTPRCNASTCQVQSCTGGFGNCDNSATNGCEVTLATSTPNCGACGAACTNGHGTTRCTASACVPTCGTGYGDCDTSRPNGCETSLTTTSNCGMCGRTCPANGGTAVCNAGVCDTICDWSGTYALKMSVTGNWPNATYIKSGSGTFQFWMKLQGTHSGNNIAATLTECGRFVPDFAATMVSETYNYGYPNTLFDGNFLPSSSTNITLGSSSPGATFALPAVATQMGVNMADPINGAWPNAASGIAAGIRVDMDADGKPGVTAVYSNAGSLEYPRTSTSFIATRSDQPYVASRVAFSLNGTLSSCTQSTGSGTFTHIDTRIFACRESGGSACSTAEANFLDSNCVGYTMPSTATYTLVKVANGASCATIRAALP